MSLIRKPPSIVPLSDVKERKENTPGTVFPLGIDTSEDNNSISIDREISNCCRNLWPCILSRLSREDVFFAVDGRLKPKIGSFGGRMALQI